MALKKGSGKPLGIVRKCSEQNMGQNLRADLLKDLESRDHRDGFLSNFSDFLRHCVCLSVCLSVCWSVCYSGTLLSFFPVTRERLMVLD